MIARRAKKRRTILAVCSGLCAKQKIATKQPAGDELFHDDVDELLRNEDDFDNLAAIDVLGDLFIGEGKLPEGFLARLDRYANPSAQLAIHLNGKFKFF